MDNGAGIYRRFLEGDDNAVVELIRDYKDGLILFLNRYVDNIHAAEDLAEDTFVRIVTRKPRFVSRHTFKTWLYTIGRNVALDYLRRNRRVQAVPDEALDVLGRDMDELEHAYLREEQKITVHRALAALKPDYSRVLYLKFFEELQNDQIAAVMHRNRRQVENLLYQAKLSLKAELEKEGFQYEGL